MNDLIKITKSTIGAEVINSVDAREIHSYLEIKTPFSMWIKRAIEKYDFEDGQDFTTHKFVNGKATQTDYIVSFDMAKELCLVEPNEKGKETRKYFIEVEKTKNRPLTYEEVMQNALLLADKKVKELENKIQLDLPKVAFATTVEASINSVLIRDWAKSIDLKEKDVRSWLNKKGYIFRDVKGSWCVYANDTAKKYFESVPTTKVTNLNKLLRNGFHVECKHHNALKNVPFKKPLIYLEEYLNGYRLTYAETIIPHLDAFNFINLG